MAKMKMKVATRTFDCVVDGMDDTVIAGKTYCASDHELVRRFPDAWRDETLDDELKLRSARIAEHQREDDERATRAELERSPRVKRDREEEAFWRSVDRLIHDDRTPSAERREQAFFDQALEDVAQARADRFDAEIDDYSKAWGRRIA